MNKRKAIHALRAKERKALLGDFMLEDAHQYRINRHTFTVYVGGDPNFLGWHASEPHSEPGVEHLMADRFEINLDLLSGIDDKRPILVNMSSCGGYWDEGMKIFSAILHCPNPVTVLATKWARSMTSLIPLAADRFVIRPPAQYMYHYGTFGFSGLNQEAETENAERVKNNDLMLRLYTARLQEQGAYREYPAQTIKKMLDENMRRRIDVWHTSGEAVELGFADAEFDGNYHTLRAKKRNNKRRELMASVIRTPFAPSTAIV